MVESLLYGYYFFNIYKFKTYVGRGDGDMGMLSSKARKVAEKKNLGSEDRVQLSYPTGMDLIDYRLGNFTHLA